MAEGFLKKGFDNLFDPQYRFNSDKSFSKFIFIWEWILNTFLKVILNLYQK